MKTSTIAFIFLIYFTSTNLSFSNDISDLHKYIKQFRLKAVDKPKGFSKLKYELGKDLFNDNILSMSNNVSCATCHDVNFGTSDGLPLSLGEGGQGIGIHRTIGVARKIVPRNAPALFNLEKMGSLFWDGRVSYDGFEFMTPEKDFNGYPAKRSDITDVMTSAASMQALFPIVNPVEMLGAKYSHLSNFEVWDKIVDRIKKSHYFEKFQAAFGVSEINIGHIGEVLGHFQIHEFAITNTPWDKFLRGDESALSRDEVKGALVFFEQGRCINCHGSSTLGGHSFHNIAAPQIGPGQDIQHNDEGMFHISGREMDRYRFRTPALRNVALSAPYFHSGAYRTLEDVIDHYANGTKSLDNYNEDWLSVFEKNNYKQDLYVERNSYRLFRKKENAHPLMRGHRIRLDQTQKSQLLLFMKKSLTQAKFGLDS